VGKIKAFGNLDYGHGRLGGGGRPAAAWSWAAGGAEPSARRTTGRRRGAFGAEDGRPGEEDDRLGAADEGLGAAEEADRRRAGGGGGGTAARRQRNSPATRRRTGRARRLRRWRPTASRRRRRRQRHWIRSGGGPALRRGEAGRGGGVGTARRRPTLARAETRREENRTALAEMGVLGRGWGKSSFDCGSETFGWAFGDGRPRILF